MFSTDAYLERFVEKYGNNGHPLLCWAYFVQEMNTFFSVHVKKKTKEKEKCLLKSID